MGSQSKHRFLILWRQGANHRTFIFIFIFIHDCFPKLCTCLPGSHVSNASREGPQSLPLPSAFLYSIFRTLPVFLYHGCRIKVPSAAKPELSKILFKAWRSSNFFLMCFACCQEFCIGVTPRFILSLALVCVCRTGCKDWLLGTNGPNVTILEC